MNQVENRSRRPAKFTRRNLHFVVEGRVNGRACHNENASLDPLKLPRILCKTDRIELKNNAEPPCQKGLFLVLSGYDLVFLPKCAVTHTPRGLSKILALIGKVCSWAKMQLWHELDPYIGGVPP